MRRDQLAPWDRIGQNVRDAIAERGTTVSAVADAISMPRSTLRRRLAPGGGRLLVEDTVDIAYLLEPERAVELLTKLYTVPGERHLRVV